MLIHQHMHTSEKMADAFSQPGLLVSLSEMSDRNRSCQPGGITLHSDVSPGPTTWQTPFLRRSEVPTPLKSSKYQQSCS